MIHYFSKNGLKAIRMNHPQKKIKVIIVDNHALFAEGLAAMFKDSIIEVVGIVDNQRSLISSLRSNYTADIILLDLNLGNEDGFTIIDHLKEKGYPQKIIILTTYNSHQIIAKAKSKNIEGYVLKNITKDDILGALTTVSEGGKYFDRSMNESNRPDTEIVYSDDFLNKYKLTKREYEVFILLAKSYSTKEISEKLFLSEQTVSTYRKYIKSKLKLKSIADIVRFAFVNELL